MIALDMTCVHVWSTSGDSTTSVPAIHYPRVSTPPRWDEVCQERMDGHGLSRTNHNWELKGEIDCSWKQWIFSDFLIWDVHLLSIKEMAMCDLSTLAHELMVRSIVNTPRGDKNIDVWFQIEDRSSVQEGAHSGTIMLAGQGIMNVPQANFLEGLGSCWCCWELQILLRQLPLCFLLFSTTASMAHGSSLQQSLGRRPPNWRCGSREFGLGVVDGRNPAPPGMCKTL